MVDAQGRKIPHEGITKAKIRLTGKGGRQVELVEEFVLGNVQHPILCAGKLLRRGWSLGNVDGSLHLRPRGSCCGHPSEQRSKFVAM